MERKTYNYTIHLILERIMRKNENLLVYAYHDTRTRKQNSTTGSTNSTSSTNTTSNNYNQIQSFALKLLSEGIVELSISSSFESAVLCVSNFHFRKETVY